jgi:anion-transporting  ArsA/GET3 family ATPase
MPENLWAKSADPKKRAEKYQAHQKYQETKEVRTKNVVRQSALDKLLHKPGKMDKK